MLVVLCAMMNLNGMKNGKKFQETVFKKKPRKTYGKKPASAYGPVYKKTQQQKTAECKEQGLVYNKSTDKCRPKKTAAKAPNTPKRKATTKKSRR